MTLLRECFVQTRFIRTFPSYVYIIVYVAAQSVAMAQQTPTFGLAAEVKSVRRARELITGDFNGDGIADIATIGDQRINVNLQLADSLGFRDVLSSLSADVSSIRVANVNGDKITDLVTISDNPPALHVYLGRAGATFSEKWVKPLPGKDFKFTLGDINNDGRIDILVFNKKEPGVTVFTGVGNGTFRPAQTLLPDYAFTALEAVDYSADRVTDLIGINWVSNEVDLFLAYGRMKFGNPAVLPFDDEPTLIVPASLDTTGMMGVVVGFADERALYVYQGDGFGGFALSQTLALDAFPTHVITKDVNQDDNADLLILSEEDRSMDIWLNNGVGFFERHIDFAAGKLPEQCATFNDRHAGNVNLAILDSAASRIRVLYNAAERPPRTGEIDYCTGLSPSGIVAADLNHDGAVDLMVANTASLDYSVFLNNGAGGLMGRIAFSVPMNPTHIYQFRKNDSLTTVLLAGKYEEKLLLSDLNLNTTTQSTYAIPTQPNPIVLGSVTGAAPGFLDLFGLEYERSTQKTYLTKFEEAAPRRYVEHNFSPVLPLLAAAVSGNHAGREALFLMTYDARKKIASVYRAGVSEPRALSPAPLFSVNAPVKPNVFMWAADLNNDGRADLIVNLRDPDNSMMIALGLKDSTFAPLQPILSDEISVAGYDRLKVADINADGLPDIVLENQFDKSIQAYLGKAGGGFLPKTRLISSIGIGGFEVADVTGDGAPELIVLDTNGGLLKIIRINQ